MRRRLLESLGVAAVMAALVIFLQLSAAGQAPAARGTQTASGPAAKTAWGHPDLQGIWLDEFDTPLERPAQYANREFFTEQERKAQDEERSGNVGRNHRAERGSQQDVAGAYNAVFTSAKPTGRRTSLVVDPPNGRIPALTAEMPGAEPARSRVPPGAPSEHRHLQEQDAGLQRLAVRAALAAPRRSRRRSTTRSA